MVILGEDPPDQLSNKVLYLPGIDLALRAWDEHYTLRKNVPEKLSQLLF